MPNQKLPTVRPAQVRRALEKAGWSKSRQKGSHLYLRKAGFPGPVCIPMHSRDVPKGTLLAIVKAASISRTEFLSLL